MNLWVEGSQRATNLASLHLLWNLCNQTHCKELNRELFLLDSVVSPGGMDKAVPAGLLPPATTDAVKQKVHATRSAAVCWLGDPGLCYEA
jgi:hypothetical protein